MPSPSATEMVQDDRCPCLTGCGSIHTDNRWETYYGDVHWGLPSLRCPHSQGASTSRLMRLLAHRTHTTCTSQTPPVSVRDRRVARALTPTPSSASLSSTSTSSSFTHCSTSTPPTTPPNSPFKSAQSLLASKDPFLLPRNSSLNTKTRWFERGVHLSLCHSPYAKAPHHHASLLRSSLPRRKGNFRKISHKTIDFFREEMSKNGSFSRQCLPAKYSLGDASSSIAVNAAEAALRSYEACAGFFGWHGLGLSENVYRDPVNLQLATGIRRRMRSRRRTLDVSISEEEVEEGRIRWLEIVKEIVGPVPFRARHSKNATPQLGVVRGRGQASCDTPSRGQIRPAVKNKGLSPLREDTHHPASGWQCSTPVASSAGSVRTPFGHQSVVQVAHASAWGLENYQAVGSGHGNLLGSARCVSRAKEREYISSLALGLSRPSLLCR